MTDLERAAAERLRDALEQFLLKPCPNSAPCALCEIDSVCEKLPALYYEVKQKLGEDVKNV